MLGEPDRQDAVFEFRLDLLRIDRERQRQRSAERTETSLLPMPDTLVEAYRLSLALEGQLVVAADEDLEVLQLDAGQLGLDEAVIAFLPDVQRRKPSQLSHRGIAGPAVEQAVHLVLKLRQRIPQGPKRTPARKLHFLFLP